MVELDHILLGAPDLEEGALRFETLTGVRPATGGSHAGFGTRNRLASLGEGLYFEVIAPDPAQPAAATRAERLSAMPGPALVGYCLRADGFDGLAGAVAAAGLRSREPVDMSRVRADGVRLQWSILHLEHPDGTDAGLPFLIDWKGSPHPSLSTPAGCRLKRFVALHPDADRLAAAFRALGVALEVSRALRPGCLAELDTPCGPAVLTSA
jgi:hypothetical protein